jgi:phosphoglycolate phosphatase-like HAD superfamily hydrolase
MLAVGQSQRRDPLLHPPLEAEHDRSPHAALDDGAASDLIRPVVDHPNLGAGRNFERRIDLVERRTGKQAILDFVRDTTGLGSPKFVPPEQRIATFDQDGTLWVEHPIYSQVVYCLDRVPALAEKDPKLKDVEPFKTVLSGNREAIAKLSLHDLEKVLFATLTGMSVDEFDAEAGKWLTTAKDGRWKRPYTDLIYQPMLEVMQYLRSNGYRTYIVTGGGQDFVRIYSDRVYGIPTEQVVGTAAATKFGYQKDGTRS